MLEAGECDAHDLTRLLLKALRSAPEGPVLALDSLATAKALSISQKTLFSNTAPRGAQIPCFRIGPRTLRYDIRAIRKWIDDQPTALAETNGKANE